MFNKKYIVFLILAIFCVGMTLGAVSASHKYTKEGYTFKVSDKTYKKIKDYKKHKKRRSQV